MRILIACLAIMLGSAHAQPFMNTPVTNVPVANIGIDRRVLGSGQQGETGFEPATLVTDDIYHAPQYMPGYPTSQTIWARVIDVPCHKNGEAIQCEGYNWTPSMGRAEYLFFRPVVMATTITSPAGAGPEQRPAPAEPILERKGDRN